MAMTEEDIKQMRKIALDVYEEQQKPKLDPKWIELREDIVSYCKEQFPNSTKWSGLQQQIYGVIRTSLGIHRIDKITGEQVSKERKAFEFIKQERSEWNVNND